MKKLRKLYRFRFFKGNLQKPEIQFMEDVLLPQLRFQMVRITQDRKTKLSHSFNDFLNDMGCIFLQYKNNWLTHPNLIRKE